MFRYWDAQTDDVALTRAVLRSAQSLGVEACCPAKLDTATRTDEGYRLAIDAGGTRRDLQCRYLINAGGPWINEVYARIGPEAAPRRNPRAAAGRGGRTGCSRA